MMYHVRFQWNGRQWRCTHSYDFREPEPMTKLPEIGILWAAVTTKPPLGFCRRPHKYGVVTS
jgi:hypothetical protein